MVLDREDGKSTLCTYEVVDRFANMINSSAVSDLLSRRDGRPRSRFRRFWCFGVELDSGSFNCLGDVLMT
jgi:hypothetical protein